jgi:hypothetical protein
MPSRGLRRPAARYLEIYRGALERETRLFDGMDGYLDGLESRGLRSGIVTNKPGVAHRPAARAIGTAALRLRGQRRHGQRAQARSHAHAACRRAWPASPPRMFVRGRRASATCRPRMRPACPRWSPPTATWSPMRIGGPGAATAASARPHDLLTGSSAAGGMNGVDGLAGPGRALGASSARSACWRGAPARTGAYGRDSRCCAPAQDRGHRERRTRAGAGAHARAAAGRVRRTRPRQPAEQQRSVPAAGARALARSSQDAAPTLKEREVAIESLVQPIREALAKTEAQIQASSATASIPSPPSRPRWNCWPAARICCRAKPQPGHGAAPAGRARPMGRDHLEAFGRTLRHDAACRFHRAAASQVTEAGIHPARHDRAHARAARHRGGREDAAWMRISPRSRRRRRAARAAAARHAQIVGARIRELASKQYWSQFERSPDFVVLFLPGDQFLTAALQENTG